MIEVDIEIEGRTTAGPSLEQTLDEMAGAMAHALSRRLRERGKRGDLAGQGGVELDRSPMWEGLTAVALGAHAEVVFRGASRGRGGRAVSNAEKAKTVLERHGVNVLALTEGELAGIGEATTHLVARAVGTQLPVQWGSALPSGDLADVFLQAMRRRA